MNDACRSTPTLRQVATPGAIKLISLTSECYFISDWHHDVCKDGFMAGYRFASIRRFIGNENLIRHPSRRFIAIYYLLRSSLVGELGDQTCMRCPLHICSGGTISCVLNGPPSVGLTACACYTGEYWTELKWIEHFIPGPILRNFSGCTISKVHVWCNALTLSKVSTS